MPRKALGKGLEALIPTEGTADEDAGGAGLQPVSRKMAGDEVPEGDSLRALRVEKIKINPWQPRSGVDERELRGLADSIKEKGLLQPIVVRRCDDGYELVAGERRFLAGKMAGLERVPAVVRDVSNREMLEIALVENLQREDLNAIDEAKAYKRLREEFGLTQEEIAARVGKDRASVANQIRLLHLPSEIQEYVSRGTLTAGHGRALLSIADSSRQLEIAQQVVEKGLSVRETERIAQRKQRARRRTQKHTLTSELSALEDRLREHLATKVTVKPAGNGGAIEIQYYSTEDLERILELMGAWRAPH